MQPYRGSLDRPLTQLEYERMAREFEEFDLSLAGQWARAQWVKEMERCLAEICDSTLSDDPKVRLSAAAAEGVRRQLGENLDRAFSFIPQIRSEIKRLEKAERHDAGS